MRAAHAHYSPLGLNFLVRDFNMSSYSPLIAGVDVNSALEALSGGGGGSLTDGVLQNIISQVEAAAAAAPAEDAGTSAAADEAGPATVEAAASEDAGVRRRRLTQVGICFQLVRLDGISLYIYHRESGTHNVGQIRVEIVCSDHAIVGRSTP